MTDDRPRLADRWRKAREERGDPRPLPPKSGFSSTRLMIAGGSAVAIWAAYREAGNFGAIVAAMLCGVVYMLHVIEVKLNKILDHLGLFVSKDDLDR